MPESIEALVASIARELASSATGSGAKHYTVADYPMLEKHSDEIRTPTGKTMSEITLESVLDGTVKIQDVRISPEMLEAQAEIAADAGKPAMGENLRRAGELTRVPDNEVIRMYDMLRPHRSTGAQLDTLAETLEKVYGAPLCAALVREAAHVYEKRDFLKKIE